MPRAKRSKFGNKPTVADGIKHASKKQALRWVLLRQWEREGRIKNLQREVSFPIVVKGEKICTYRADHVYHEPGVCRVVDGAYVMTISTQVVEDVKGFKTAEYRLKKKLMRAVHGIEIREV